MIRFSRVLATFGAAAIAFALVAGTADARSGGGSSFGSRGMRTFSTPAPTQPRRRCRQCNAPRPSRRRRAGSARPRRPLQSSRWPVRRRSAGRSRRRLSWCRSVWPPVREWVVSADSAVLPRSLACMIQIVLVVIVARLIWGWWQRRQQPAFAAPGYGRQPMLRDVDDKSRRRWGRRAPTVRPVGSDRHRARRLRCVRASPGRDPGGVQQRRSQRGARAGNARNGVVLRGGPWRATPAGAS